MQALPTAPSREGRDGREGREQGNSRRVSSREQQMREGGTSTDATFDVDTGLALSRVSELFSGSACEEPALCFIPPKA